MTSRQDNGVGCLVLAAGRSSRFSGIKQLANLCGKPLLRYSLDAAIDSDCELTTVVLGAHADKITQKIDFDAAELVECESWEEGMAASLRTGLRRLHEMKAVVVLLGDEPLIGAEAVNRLIGSRDGEHPAARATYSGVPGHPVLIERELFTDIGEIHGDRGARSILADFDTLEVPCEDIADPLDVDTPADLKKAELALPLQP